MRRINAYVTSSNALLSLVSNVLSQRQGPAPPPTVECLVDGRLYQVSENRLFCHYSDVMIGGIASQITSLTIVYAIVYISADQRKHQSSASLAFVRGIPRRNGQLRGKCSISWRHHVSSNTIRQDKNQCTTKSACALQYSRLIMNMVDCLSEIAWTNIETNATRDVLFSLTIKTSNGSWRQGIKGECPAQLMSHCHGISFIEYVFESHYLSHHYGQISTYCLPLGPHTLIIKYA